MIWARFLHIFGTCSRHFGCFGHPFGICSRHLDHFDSALSGSAANPTATTSVTYRQRLNGPNVKITTRRIAGFSQLVALLRGPGEQPGSTPTSDGHRQRQRSRAPQRRSHEDVQLPFPDFLYHSVSARQKFLDGWRQPRFKSEVSSRKIYPRCSLL